MDISMRMASSAAPPGNPDGRSQPEDRFTNDDASNHSSLPAEGLSCRGRVLIAEDDEPVRETMAELLEISGFYPLQACDAQEALTLLRSDNAIQVLVTDLTMPGDDGITLIRKAREIRAGLPAILLTGYAEQVTSVTIDAGGNFHVLRKPVQSDRLIEQLMLLLGTPR